jgi:DNA polymerase-1
MSTLLLVDGHAYAYRAFHAIRSLNGPDGRATNAIFGFVKMLARMRGVVKPSHIAVVWDGGLSRERMELLPEYKAQRPSMPDDLASQIEEIIVYLGAARIPSLLQEDVEADDIIASLARMAVQGGDAVVIASADKDFFQLVSPSVGLLNPNDKSDTIWAAAQVMAKTGVEPAQVIDWLSLIGDAVDNIRGVPGVGPKTAADLLLRFGSIESLYGRLSEVKSEKLRESLRLAADVVRRNQRMIRLKDDLPELVTMNVLVAAEPDYGSLVQLYHRWGFKGLAAEAERLGQGEKDLFADASK